MKAVAIDSKNKSVEIKDVPEPKITKPGQVLVRTLEVGLCGTDREIVDQGYGAAPEGFDYLILGHECLAEVVDVGDQVSMLKPGQLVVPRVRRSCGIKDCPACRIGRPDFCLTGQYKERGILKEHGYMCEHFVDDQVYFHIVPDELRGSGVLTEPLTIAEKSLIQVRDVQDRLPYIDVGELKHGCLEGFTAVVLGAGPVGLLGALAMLNSGGRVIVYSREEKPNPSAELIERLGGEYVSSAEVNAEQFRELAERVDIIYEATGASAFAFEMTSLLGRNGIYIFTGVPGRKAPVKIDTARIMTDMVLKNQLLVGSVNAGPPAFASAIHTLGEVQRRWPSAMKEIITDRIKPEEVAAHLTGQKKGIKTVVEFA